MPVTSQARLGALVQDFGTQSRVAQVLQVDRSRVSRWLRGEEPDEANRARLEGFEFVLARLSERFPRQTALRWLEGVNPHLNDRRPVDLLRSGRIAEVLEAVEAELAEAYA